MSKIKLRLDYDDENKVYYTRDFEVISDVTYRNIYENKGYTFKKVLVDIEEKNEILCTHNSWKVYDNLEDTYEYLLVPDVVEITVKPYQSNIDIFFSYVGEKQGAVITFTKDDFAILNDDEIDELITDKLYSYGNLTTQQFDDLMLSINIWLGR